MKISPVKLLTTEKYMTIDQHRRWLYGRKAIERAYAKLNLGLKVIGKRPDGFHDLDMVNCEINIFDDVICHETKSSLEVICNVDICPVEDNLVYKVAKHIIDKYKINKSVKIELVKRIPFGAGLAGGSSDAAATIRALNRLWNLKLSSKEMLDIASSVGSDVSYLLEGGLARVQGVGNRIEIIKSSMNFYVVLVVPDYKSFTKEVFNKYNSQHSDGDISELFNAIKKEDYVQFSRLLCNDLQPVVNDAAIMNQQVTPDEIALYLKEVGCDSAIMTGSGSSVFGISEDVYKAKIACNKIKDKYPNFDVIFTKIINEKPSVDELEDMYYPKDKPTIIFLK